jgi:hypothetical protein
MACGNGRDGAAITVSGTSPWVRVSGTVRSPGFFRFLEPHGFNPRDVVRVVRGEVAGCLFHGAIDPAACRQVAQNFWRHRKRRRRRDNVPAYFLGTYHYRKPLDEYFEEVTAHRDALREVFDGCENFYDRVMSSVGSVLAEDGVAMRVAAHAGRTASEFVMRSWCGRGRFSLEPHEDGAQLTSALQRGFEIQRVATSPVVAVNMCLENPGAGELHYWNIEPDAESRGRLGLQETGYPYPLETLDGTDKLVIPIHPGDVYFFNGRHIHAVAAQDDAAGYRSTISSLMGFADPRTVIYWS